MSHKLATNPKTGQAAFMNANTNTPAWHGLGTMLEGLATAEEAMKYAGLDFQVEKRPVYIKHGRSTIEVPGKFATVRTDTNEPLGVVGSGYTPLQNNEAFSFFDPIIDEKEAVYETAGVIGNGHKIWIMAKMPEHIIVGKDDEIKPYVTIMNSHDGSGAVRCFLNLTRIVCNNTLNASISERKNFVNVVHTRNVKTRIEQAHEVLGLANLLKNELSDIFNSMAKTKLKSKDVEAYFELLYPRNPDTKGITNGDRIREKLLEVYESGIGQDMKTSKGTVFGLYNAVTHYIDHNKEYDNETLKLSSIWMGGSAQIRQKAFDLATTMALN